jgi:starch synthase
MAQTGVTAREPVVAILPWGNVLEDYLDEIGGDFASFRDEMTGGWLFGYVDALARAGVRAIVVGVSRALGRAERHVHHATGAPIWLLPEPRAYSHLRRRMRSPYLGLDQDAFPGDASGARRALRDVGRDLVPYLATPPRALARVLGAERCTAILVQEYEYPRFDVAIAVGAALGIPVSATFQGGDWHMSRFERALRPRTIGRARALIIPSTSEARRVRERYRVPDERIHRIFNPLDLSGWGAPDRVGARRALGIPERACVVVWHGRVNVGMKGLDVLARAWSRVCAARPERELRLLLIGSGAESEQLDRILAEGMVPSVVRRAEFVNHRAELGRLISAGDVAVLASRREGLPVAPLEAMALGLPLVATDVAGVRDILEQPERHGGIVVPAADPEALARALGELIDDPERRASLGARARERATSAFDAGAVGAQLAAVLAPERGA